MKRIGKRNWLSRFFVMEKLLILLYKFIIVVVAWSLIVAMFLEITEICEEHNAYNKTSTYLI